MVPHLSQVYLLPISKADLVLPDNDDDVRQGRGINVHEFGHFSMCSLLYDNGYDSLLLGRYLRARIDAGHKIEGSDGVSIVSDAFADFVAGQVVGGVNYPEPMDTAERHGMNYCYRAECMEGNANGRQRSGGFEFMPSGDSATEEGYTELARAGTTWLDAFDGHYTVGQPRGNTPGNVDYYSLSGGTLAITNAGWMTIPVDTNRNGLPDADTDYDGKLDDTCPCAGCCSFTPTNADDEKVSLSGAAMVNWVKNWGFFIEALNVGWVDATMLALDQEMYENGVSWCDRCDLFALHQDGVPKPWDAGTSYTDRWRACTQGRLATYVGGPPDVNLNMRPGTCEPCDAHHYLDPADGQCKQCASDEKVTQFGCEACPAGTVPTGDGLSCSGCEGNRIAQNGVCVECPHGKGANKTANTCDPCPDDADPVDLSEPTCTTNDVSMTQQAPNDVCPDFFVFRVTGLTAGGPLTTKVEDSDYTNEMCLGESATVGLFDEAGNELMYLYSPQGTFTQCTPTMITETIQGTTETITHEVCLGQNCSWAAPEGISAPDVVRLMIDVPESPRPALKLSGSSDGCVYTIY